MYRVTFSTSCSKQLLKLRKNNQLTESELITIRAWVMEMTLLGPFYISSCGYWNDHELEGNRSEQRASSFSESGRIIYKIKKGKIEICVIKITPDHDYR